MNRKSPKRMRDESSEDERKAFRIEKKKNPLFTKFKPPPPRRSLREQTKKNTSETNARQLREAMKPSWGHATAQARAIDDSTSPLAPLLNQARVKALKQGKAYKDGTFRIHFKGEKEAVQHSFGTFNFTRDYTSGTPLSGARISRSGWSSDQTAINQDFGKKLMQTPDFTGAKNSKSYHGAEIAHLRAQHAGGLTDPLGAQSASWHSNVEDMAREEGQAHLAKHFVGDVRLKSTAYIHQSGDLAGTVKASRHKIYFRNNDGNWEKKFDHLQDGARGNINKSEARDLKETVKNLSPNSPNVTLHLFTKGILRNSSVSTQNKFVPKSNDTALSPYFTDLRARSPHSGTTNRFAGQDASFVMKKFLSDVVDSRPKK